MLELLEDVKAELPDLMIDENAWQSLFIDYHLPLVSRLWMPWREYRLSLHKIHPCTLKQALFHPHPWPSAMEIIYGTYQYAIGFGPGSETPPIAQLGVAVAGSKYEMTHPDAWHSVAPINTPAHTIMLTGKPWDRWLPSSGWKLNPLVEENKIKLLETFRHQLGYKSQYLSHDIRNVAENHTTRQLSYYAAVAHVAKCWQCENYLAEQFRDRLRLPSD